MSRLPESPKSPAVAARSIRIAKLIPVLSRFRSAQNTEAREIAELLQVAVRDLERLNDIEMLCFRADDKLGPTLWLEFMKILEKP